jgi:group II intron reverse transcriptase/maturase
VEGRGCRIVELLEGQMTRTPTLGPISTKLQQIAGLARQQPKAALRTLAHHIDIDWLREAYRRTRKTGAPGIDRQTAQEYARNLEQNLQSLLARAKSGRYRAPAVRRVHIPKRGGSSTRPIGIPTFEDKVLQRAVAMVLEAVYEQDFLDCSYGFRPGRSAHQALGAIREPLMTMGGGWVLEVDIRSFFETLDHGLLRGFLRQRVRDGVLLRLIGKWLRAGVMEDRTLHYPESGTPQGGVISPLLANIYLHEVVDQWFESVVKPRLKGLSFMVRYADDLVLTFSSEEDARRVMAVLPKRFGKFGLALHPEKTRLVSFGKPRSPSDRVTSRSSSKPDTFDFLGFTHYWARSRRGYWVIKRQTARPRFRRAVQETARWCRRHRHRPVTAQHQMLVRKLRGHYAYYGITGNSPSLGRFRHEVIKAWRKWLDRRSRSRRMSWERFRRLLERYPLPYATSVHSAYRLVANP